MNLIQIQAERPSVAPDIIFKIKSFPVSSSLLMILLILAIIIFVCILIKKKFRIIPQRFQSILEVFYEAMYNLVEQITGEKKHTQKLFPLIASLFIFIGLSNLLGILIPFLGSFTYAGKPIFSTPTADFNTTLSLALAMVLMIQVVAIRKKGAFKHLSNYFKFSEVIQGFKQGIKAGLLSIINFFIGLLDIVSEIARVISLSMRLFGNMFAGEMLAIVILGFLAYGLPAVWMTMSLLVGAIQAMVFGSLTAAYYMLSTVEQEN
ncbi:F0F1 ATP synthase subunit A [Patescibacteria group bacterium]|nr:F0F1 ATP synthase subunit A [Patescibacteria group bacterium]